MFVLEVRCSRVLSTTLTSFYATTFWMLEGLTEFVERGTSAGIKSRAGSESVHSALDKLKGLRGQQVCAMYAR